MRVLKFRLFILSLALIFGSTLVCSKPRAREYLVEVTFPEGLKAHLVPVTLELPSQFSDTATSVWEVSPVGGGREPAGQVYAQLRVDRGSQGESGRESKKITFLWDPTAGGITQRFILRPASGEIPQVFSFEDRGKMLLTLSQGGTPVLSYIYGMHLKEGVPQDRRRSSYIHPVYGLDGEVFSDDFPDDHYHHRGIFWTWPQVFVGRDSLSLWDIRGIYQRFERWLLRESGPVFARLSVQNGWYVGQRRVVDEKVRLTVFRAGQVGRVLDFKFTWEAVNEPVTILGSPDVKGYGGFSFRFAPFEDPVITTSGGVQVESSDLKPFPWADLSARFEGRQPPSGVAVFDTAENIDFPNGWTLRFYGFLGVAWPGREPYTLEPGKPVNAHYRVWLHRGDAEKGKVSSVYAAYESGPRAKFIK